MTRRIAQLLIGLVLYGVGCALTIEAGLGVDPWTVFAQGVAIHTGLGIGWVANIVGFFVLLLWIPLRQKPGIGTFANILIVGTSMQVTLDIASAPTGLGFQILTFAVGLVSVAIASGLYIGAHFGPGPRDGLMTGIRARFGLPIWVARASVEVTVLAIGWILGGTVGFGTVAFAVLIGPLVHVAMPVFDTDPARTRRQRAARESGSRHARTVSASEIPATQSPA